MLAHVVEHVSSQAATYPAVCTGLVFIQSPKSQRTDMAGAVITRRNGRMFDIGGTNKAYLSVICIIRRCLCNWLDLFFSLDSFSRRHRRSTGSRTLRRIGIAALLITSSPAGPTTPTSRSPARAAIRMLLALCISWLVSSSSTSAATTTSVLALRSSGGLRRLRVGH